MNETGYMLAQMAGEIRKVLEAPDMNVHVEAEAERALISLMKSMAIHAYNIVQES